jgi:hypothetical protein
VVNKAHMRCGCRQMRKLWHDAECKDLVLGFPSCCKVFLSAFGWEVIPPPSSTHWLVSNHPSFKHQPGQVQDLHQFPSSLKHQKPKSTWGSHEWSQFQLVLISRVNSRKGIQKFHVLCHHVQKYRVDLWCRNVM